MDFEETLTAQGDDLSEYLRTYSTPAPIPETVFLHLKDRLRTYYITGGMPEVVKDWIENKDLEEELLYSILDAYRNDSGKYSSKTAVSKIHLIWDSRPSQLARENKKLLYSAAWQRGYLYLLTMTFQRSSSICLM